MNRVETFGIIVATKQEYETFDDVYGKPDGTFWARGRGYDYKTYESHQFITIIVILSGYGEIAAAAATQYAISELHVDRIINYGVAGSLRDGYSTKDFGIVEKVVHYGFDLSGGGKYPVGKYPNQYDLYIKPDDSALSFYTIRECLDNVSCLICASADKFVYGGEPKRKLAEQFSADICEMEAAGVLITCNKNGIPCTIIKAISDGVDEDEEAFNRNVREAARVCVEFIKKVLELM